MTAVSRVLAGIQGIRAWQEEIYVDLHSHPELGSHEIRTAGEVRRHLTELGFDVDDVGGGVVGTLANGPGACVLVRADMDGLPVTEETGLSYASTATTSDDQGEIVGVMHACGHDVHVTALLSAARLLAESRETWQGTFVALFQPAEETAAGAGAMLDAGLVESVPRPDVAFAQHVLGLEAGTVSTVAGPALASADSIRVTVHGTGSHGAMPNLGVDPIVTSAAIVQRLQGIVARELPPGERAVVTVGAIHAGSRSNVIPDRATLLVNTRSYSAATRTTVLGAIERMVRAECAASRCPVDPEFEYYDQFPLTVNDVAVTERIRGAMRKHFGEDRVLALAPLPASEDFSRIPDAFGTPYTYWGLGGFPAGVTAPANHSPFFAPVPQPTLTTGTEAIIVAALTYLAEEAS